MVPIAAGHALAVAAVVVVVAALRPLIDFTALQVSASFLLIGFGIYRLTARHRGRAGMQIGAGQLLAWSSVMATAHGAGLMLIPVLLRIPVGVGHAGHAHGAAIAALGQSLGHSLGHSLGDPTTTALAAVGVHTLAMFATAGAIAIVVYKWVGLAFLRRGWVNFDLVWSFALIATGVGLLATAILMR
jgi:hypothetical protein